MVNRTQVAEYLAGQLSGNREETVHQAAAWLVATGRGRQANYLARDVATALTTQGYLWVQVTTARPLDPELRAVIEAFLRHHTGAKTIELEALVNPDVIGGLRIETSIAKLDATVHRQLAKLVEGV